MLDANKEHSSEMIAALELIPGQLATTAEVWVSSGPLPGALQQESPYVVLRADDWPMNAERARQLAAALMRAADTSERRPPSSRRGSGPPEKTRLVALLRLLSSAKPGSRSRRAVSRRTRPS